MNVPCLNTISIKAQEISNFFDANNLQYQKIDVANWVQQFPYKPLVTFRIAHNKTSILLEYIVKEDSVRAKYEQPNEAVWTDSCVEFFFSPDNSQSYYNLEMNCIGTPLLSFRPQPKVKPNVIANDILSKLDIYSTLGNKPFEEQHGFFTWTLTAVIPTNVFVAHPKLQLSDSQTSGNFYKCGDELTKPHFLSWTKIEHPTPNFHLPRFFGQLIFE